MIESELALLRLRKSDQAEVVMCGELWRYSQWNGRRFAQREIVEDVRQSLAFQETSYTLAFEVGDVQVYRAPERLAAA